MGGDGTAKKVEKSVIILFKLKKKYIYIDTGRPSYFSHIFNFVTEPISAGRKQTSSIILFILSLAMILLL